MHISDVRIAQIWVAPGTVPLIERASGALSAIGVDYLYPNFFDHARFDSSSEVTLPWPPGRSDELPRTNRFWRRHIISHILRQKDHSPAGAVAWKRLTPLRLKTNIAPITIGPQQRRFFGERYIWPTAVGLLTNVSFGDESAPVDVRALLESLRNGNFPAGGGTTRRMTAIAHEALRKIYRDVWADDAAALDASPITLISVIKAKNISKTAIDAALATILAACSDVMAETLKPTAAHGEGKLYTGRRTILVWDPVQFARTDPVHALGCLHRNLTFAALQMEALAVTAAMLADAVQNGMQLPDPLIYRARNTLQQIQEFRSGATYSPPFHNVHFEHPPVPAAIARLAQL
jgi:hypothetical protein